MAVSEAANEALNRAMNDAIQEAASTAEVAGGRDWQPLRGLRVVDFSLLLPGPYATLALADLGADVVRVESPQGDMVRRLPMAMFRMSNRNKRGIALDLKHPEAREVIARLARLANFSI